MIAADTAASAARSADLAPPPSPLDGCSVTPQAPFGLLIEAGDDRDLRRFTPDVVHRLMRQHRVVAFRGFDSLLGDDFPRWCTRLGELLDWEFGTVNTLKVDPDKKNYLYTQAKVPMHWDGAFLHTPPHYICFHCDIAADGPGGETTFTDTVRLLERLDPDVIEQWEDINATYITEKVVHYGGDFMSAILGEHPVTGERTLRYAEPVEEINPVAVFLHGLPVEKHKAFIDAMQQRLYDPELLYAHRWVAGDIVLADNHALLHGRFALTGPERKIRRVNVMTADFDADGNWVPPVDGQVPGLEGYKPPELPPKKECTGQGLLDFKRKSDPSAFPNAFADYVKSYGDIYHWPYGGFHVITRAADAKAILANKKFTANRATFFVSKMPDVDLDLIGDFFQVVSRMMVMSDGPVHRMRRRSGMYGINRELIEHFVPRIEAICDRLLQPLRDTGEMEFVKDVARVLPSTVLADLFGIDEEDREEFRRCANIMTGFFGGSVAYTNEVAKECNDATLIIREYFRKVLLDRKKNPQKDFLSGMLEAQDQYNLTDDELISQAAMMLVAGQVTTTDQMCNNLFLMLDDPERYRQLVEDPSLIPNAQEEFKRFDPAVTFLFRVAKERIVINGQRIDAGDTVFMAGHCLNRDPELYADADVIDMQRQDIRHFAYGQGAHYCIGAYLGRLMINAIFTKMVAEFPNLHFSGPAVRDHYSLSFSGFLDMPLAV